ncbi:interferon-induced protein 44-like [Hoplias malabaricus]|uniref:interferon-induced protein 44-like n=1 Tax=Hoplias malabaricus TaxID=27720 RepID=UPI003461D337
MSSSQQSLTKSDKEEILKDLDNVWTKLETLRILLLGPTGAGKSCFINSVQRVLLGRNAIGALEHTTQGGASFTRSIRTHQMKKRGGECFPFVFCDIMGLEPDEAGGIKIEDITAVLEGRIMDGFTFNPLVPITAENQKYNTNPHPCEKVHCLVSILPADSISRMSDKVIDKMKVIRQKASHLNIPQAIVMTKVDLACELVNKDLTKIYHSKKIKEKVQVCSNKLGISLNSIYPVKNYHEEITQDPKVDVLILMALRDILNFASDYANDQYK